MRYKPLSIEDIGLETYLNNKQERHNGQGYKEFCLFIKSGVNKTNLARVFSVTNHTIDKWLKIYAREAAKTVAKEQ